MAKPLIYVVEKRCQYECDVIGYYNSFDTAKKVVNDLLNSSIDNDLINFGEEHPQIVKFINNAESYGFKTEYYDTIIAEVLVAQTFEDYLKEKEQKKIEI